MSFLNMVGAGELRKKLSRRPKPVQIDVEEDRTLGNLRMDDFNHAIASLAKTTGNFHESLADDAPLQFDPFTNANNNNNTAFDMPMKQSAAQAPPPSAPADAMFAEFSIPDLEIDVPAAPESPNLSGSFFPDRNVPPRINSRETGGNSNNNSLNFVAAGTAAPHSPGASSSTSSLAHLPARRMSMPENALAAGLASSHQHHHNQVASPNPTGQQHRVSFSTTVNNHRLPPRQKTFEPAALSVNGIGDDGAGAGFKMSDDPQLDELFLRANSAPSKHPGTEIDGPLMSGLEDFNLNAPVPDNGLWTTRSSDNELEEIMEAHAGRDSSSGYARESAVHSFERGFSMPEAPRGEVSSSDGLPPFAPTAYGELSSDVGEDFMMSGGSFTKRERAVSTTGTRETASARAAAKYRNGGPKSARGAMEKAPDFGISTPKSARGGGSARGSTRGAGTPRSANSRRLSNPGGNNNNGGGTGAASGSVPGTPRPGMSKQRSRRKPKTYVNKEPSTYCHICARDARRTPAVVCSNFGQGTCRKVICKLCFEKLLWDFDAALVENSGWVCSHCSDSCPTNARCHIYDRINAKRLKE